MPRTVYVLRYFLMNLTAIGLVAAAWLQHWLDGLMHEFTWPLAAVICLVFLYGLATCGIRVWQTNRDIDRIGAGSAPAGSEAARYLTLLRSAPGPYQEMWVGALRLSLGHGVALIGQIANMLVFLGLIGTVIGFIIALSGIDAESVTRVETVAPMISTLISGMSVALYTTLLGAVLNVWLTLNHRLLASSTVALIRVLVEEAARDDTL